MSDRGGERSLVIAPETALPAGTRFALASVVAPDAATADAWATALLADPDRALPALRHLEAAALLADHERNCFVSNEMMRMLT